MNRRRLLCLGHVFGYAFQNIYNCLPTSECYRKKYDKAENWKYEVADIHTIGYKRRICPQSVLEMTEYAPINYHIKHKFSFTYTYFMLSLYWL